MKKRTFISSICLCLITAMLLCALPSCNTDTSTDIQQPTKEDTPMELISLNGQWNFYRDDAAVAGQTKCIPSGEQSLQNGKTAAVTLTVKQPEQTYYSKLQLSLRFSGDITTTGGAPTVYAQIGDGRRFYADISDYTHNLNSDLHTIDVGLYFADLVQGDNIVTVGSNVTSGEIVLTDAALCYYPVLMFDNTLQQISVPGVWETQLGAEYTNYNGVGWYTRTFDLPTAQDSRQYTLTFDAIDYYAEIWLNGRFITSHEDGYSAVVIDLAEYTDILQQHDNRLVVRVTDQDTSSNATFPIKQTLAGFYHDSVGINFAGIWGDVYLTPRGQTRVTDITIQTNIDTMSASILATLKNPVSDATVDATISILDGDTVLSSEKISGISVDQGNLVAVDSEQILSNAALWEISAPKVYTVRIELYEGETCMDTEEATFGFTSIATEGNKILFNGRGIKINGVLSWLGNWDQISPKFDEAFFTAQIRMLKEYGFNCIKFCLVVPTESILDICDREGIYVYIEYPIWNPVQTNAFYERAYSQMGRFLNMSKNHPSVIMSDFNCEMQVFEDPMLDLMNWCVNTGKAIDTNRLFADNSSTGRQNTDGENDFWTWHPYTNALNFANYAQSVVNNRTAKEVKPVVFGEYADYPALADFEKIIAANGGEEPWNWSAVDDPFRADIYLKNLGYSDEQIQRMIAYSQENCVDMKMYYVQETKKADGVAAYFLTIIQDIGHSVAGFFDELGDPKFTADQTAFLRESVLLMKTNVYNFTAGKEASITPAISHYSGVDIENGTLAYTLTDRNGTVVSEGELLDGLDIENASYLIFDKVTLEMPDVDTASAHTLTLTLTDDNGYTISNFWEIYLYPDTAADDAFAGKTVMVAGDKAAAFKKRYPSVKDWKNGSNPDLLIVFGSMSEAHKTYLKNGGKVLYFGTGSEVARVEKGTFYSQYVMVHFPQEDHDIVKALDSKGFGGLQFLNLQTEYVITQNKETPLSHSIIGKLLLRDNVGDIGQSASYMSEFTVGQGTVIQCTLNVSGDSVLGNYLIDVAAEYLLK